MDGQDVIVCKLGKFFDFITVTPDCDYIVDTIEPFLDLSVAKDNPLARQKLDFADEEGKKYSRSVSELVRSGIKIYYHDAELKFNPDKFPGTRRKGMAEAMLEEIDYFVVINNII